jgi:predicted TIM-barrel fold metal-dependent hydrolase
VGGVDAAMIDINAEYGTASPGVHALGLGQLSEARARSGIDIALVRHRAAVRVGRELGNDRLFDELSGTTGLLPIATVTTVGVDRLSGELARAVKRGARGIWIEPRDPWSMPSESVRAALSIAASHRLPLLMPCRQGTDATAIGTMTEGLDVPVVLVGAHYVNYPDIFAALRRYPALHVETSSLGSFGAVEALTRVAGAERVLFGTGMPARTPRSSLNAVRVSRLPDDTKRAILRGNAARLFGFGPHDVDLTAAAVPARAIDVHGHFFPAPWEVEQPRDEEILPDLRRFGIRIRMASAVPALYGDLDFGNRKTVAACGSIDGQLGYLVADPNDLDATKDQLRRYGTARGIVGVKVHCVISGQPTGSTAIRDLFAVLADYGHPVKIHNAGQDWEFALLALVQKHPKLPIIIAHGGPGRPSAAAARVVNGSDRVFVELASSTADINETVRLVGSIDPSRILFGTDAPLLDPAFVLGTYHELGFTADELRRVFWDNAAELFSISDQN